MPDTPPHPYSIATDVVVVILAAMALLLVVRQMRQNSHPFPYQSRRPVPWGLIDLGLILMVMIVTQVAMLATTNWVQSLNGVVVDPKALTLDQQIIRMMADSASKLLTLFIGFALVQWRCKASFDDLGWPRKIRMFDISSGFLMFFLIVVPVFAIQLVLSLFFKPEHPIIKLLLETPSPMFFIICSVMAIFVAPVVEEFLFRVIIQGWLENVATYWKAGRPTREKTNYPQVVLGGSLPIMSNVDSGEPTGSESEFPLQPSWWPIVASSLLFALAHLGNSSDPIPLFVFACGLGYLYQRTHRLLPCIIVHMLLNSISMWKLWLLVQTAK